MEGNRALEAVKRRRLLPVDVFSGKPDYIVRFALAVVVAVLLLCCWAVIYKVRPLFPGVLGLLPGAAGTVALEGRGGHCSFLYS